MQSYGVVWASAERDTLGSFKSTMTVRILFAFDGMRSLDLIRETDWGGICQSKCLPKTHMKSLITLEPRASLNQGTQGAAS